MLKTVKDNVNLLEEEHVKDYGLALFFFAHVLSEIMEQDPCGRQIKEQPKKYVTVERDVLLNALKKQWELITPDINMDIEEYTDEHNNYFDYKNLYKNSQFVKEQSRKIIAGYIRITRRNQADSFGNIYKAMIAHTANHTESLI